MSPRLYRFLSSGSVKWRPPPGSVYLMALVPTVTDLIETGQLPKGPREWMTEIVAGLVIAALAFRSQRAQRNWLVLATTDTVTGLPNRRMFDQALAIECTRAARTRQALSLVYLELGRATPLHARSGHATDDAVRSQFAEVMRACLRAQVDQAFRIGDDAFAVLLPASQATQAQQVVTRLRAHCGERDPQWRTGALDLAAGAVEFDGSESPAALGARAAAAKAWPQAAQAHTR